jgi:uncharacterized protein involved in outer membrane biogenesis
MATLIVAMKPPWRRRRRLIVWVAGGLVFLILAVPVLGPVLAKPYVRARIQEAVAAHIDARVEIGSLSYSPPWKFGARDLRLISTSPEGHSFNLMSVQRVDLSLGAAPFGDGPLVVRRCAIDDPSIRLIRTADGFLGFRGGATTTPLEKLSELLELGDLSLAGGELILEDRTVASAVPLVWRRVNLKIRPDQIAAFERYAYEAAGGDDACSLALSGSIDVDQLLLHVEHCGLNVKLDPTVVPSAITGSPLPPAIQTILERCQARGVIRFNASGDVPLKDPATATLSATLEMSDGATARLPGAPLALQDFGDMTIRVRQGAATLSSLRAGYGGDVFYVEQATVPLTDLSKKLRVENLRGCLTFGKRPSSYPAPLAEYLDRAEPRGPYWFSGTASIDLTRDDSGSSLDYRLRITSDRAAISTMRRGIPLYNVNADVTLTPARIDVERFEADVLSGKIATTARLDLSGEQPAYTGHVRLRRVDANSLAQVAVKPGEKPITVTGEISSDFTFSGKGADASEAAIRALQAQGAVQVAKGELFRVPVLDRVAAAVRLDNAATVGEAGCSFNIAGGKLRISDAAIGAPAIGVKGSGVIDLVTHALDLQLIATPLHDWDKQIRQDDNPVANVAATIAGTVQKGINTVTAELLYRFHVGGTIEKPDVQVLAGPNR